MEKAAAAVEILQSHLFWWPYNWSSCSPGS